jgi:hypothetical protein
MNEIKRTYKTYKSAAGYWLQLLHWLRLLVLNVNRTREKLPDKYRYSPGSYLLLLLNK